MDRQTDTQTDTQTTIKLVLRLHLGGFYIECFEIDQIKSKYKFLIKWIKWSYCNTLYKVQQSKTHNHKHPTLYVRKLSDRWPEYCPLIGQCRSHDLNTGLWLVIVTVTQDRAIDLVRLPWHSTMGTKVDTTRIFSSRAFSSIFHRYSMSFPWVLR